jgi:hypothetical protein
LQHRAVIGVAMGFDARALADYEKARYLFAPLAAQDQKNLTWQIELAGIEQARLRVLARHTSKESILPSLKAVQRTLAHLLTLDPKNAAWERREAYARLRLAAALPNGSPAQEATLQAALSTLQALHQRNQTDLTGKLLLTEALLLSATLEHEKNNQNFSSSCKQAFSIISKEGHAASYYKVLDPWVRINLCLHNTGLANKAMKRLQDIGYRDSLYLKVVANGPQDNN